MSSNGGVATAKMVAERPVMTLLSGPAAGVLGGAWTGDIAERDRLITFDMGGTSADIGIVTDGRFTEASARDTWIAGYPLYPLLASIFDRFHAQHEAEYGHLFAESAIEIVNVRVSGVGGMPKIARPHPHPGGSLAEARVDTGRCLFRTASGLESFDTPFYARDRLPAEERFTSPAIIVQQDSTTVIPPGAEAMAHEHGHLVVQVGDRIGDHT